MFNLCIQCKYLEQDLDGYYCSFNNPDAIRHLPINPYMHACGMFVYDPGNRYDAKTISSTEIKNKKPITLKKHKIKIGQRKVKFKEDMANGRPSNN